MPVTKTGIGYGEYTPTKIEHFGNIVGMHLMITQAVILKWKFSSEPTYRYIDLTAGQGCTPDGLSGSPIVFLDKAEDPKFNVPFRADLIEHHSDNLAELKRAVSTHSIGQSKCPDIHFHLGEYETVVPQLFPSIKKNEYGLVYVDHTGDLPDFNTLKYFCRVRPRMEVLLYIPAVNVKRQYQQTQMLLADILNEMGKKFWLIRKSIKGDNHQWTFLLGSNSNLFKPHKAIRDYFYLLDSPEGQAVFEKLNLNQEQRFEEHQPRLPFIE